MDGVTKPRRRRRKVSNIENRKTKRICLENFFTATISSEEIIKKFQDQVQKLEVINSEKLKNIAKTIKQLKQHNLQNVVERNEIMTVLKLCTTFIRLGFVEDLTSDKEWDLEIWKSKVELTLEACLVSMSLLNIENISDEEDNDGYLNDIIFFLRKILDDVIMQLPKIRDGKKMNDIKLSELLLDNLDAVNELIKVRNFKSLNVAGLITSLIQTVFHHTEAEIQKSALLAIISFYKKGEEFQALILKLTFRSIEKLQENYKFRKNYKINQESWVSINTIYVLALVENVPILGFYSQDVYDTSTIQNSQTLLKDSFDYFMKVCHFIITTLINKISTNTESLKIYYPFFNHLVADLILVCDESEWPSAKILLNLLLKPLTEILVANPPVDVTLKMLVLKNVCEILKKKISEKLAGERGLDHLNQKFSISNDECDFTEFVQKLLIRHVRKAKKNEINHNCALLYGIQWLEDLKQKQNYEDHLLRMLKLFTCNDEKNIEDDLEGTEKLTVMYYLDTIRRNYTDNHTILKYVLCCYCEKNKRLKNMVVNSVLDMLIIDNDLLSQNTVLQIVQENIPFVSLPLKEKMYELMGMYLINHPKRSKTHQSHIIELLEVPSDTIKKTFFDAILNIIKKDPALELNKALCYKILYLIQDENPITQKQVVEFCGELWFDAESLQYVHILLDVVTMPNATKYLRLVFEKKLKPPTVPIMTDTPSEPPTEINDSCKRLIDFIFDMIGMNQNSFCCLQLASVLVQFYPNEFTKQWTKFASLLTLTEYSNEYMTEILTAEILNQVMTKIVNPDVLSYIYYRTELNEKLKSTCMNYSMGLIVSLLKLQLHLSKFDMTFLFDNCVLPNVNILNDYMQEVEVHDRKVIQRALSIVTYLHIHFEESMNFETLLNFYVEHPIFGLTTIHCLCYLITDHKSVIRKEIVTKTVEKHLKENKNTILVKASLYYIMYSLKNVDVTTADGEAVKNFIRNNIQVVIDHSTSENVEIRMPAYRIIRQIYLMDIIPQCTLTSSVLLMSGDPVSSISEFGVKLLMRANAESIFEALRNAKNCLLMVHSSNTKFLKTEFLPGYKKVNDNVIATCNHFYTLYQENVMKRAHILNSIMEGLSADESTHVFQKSFLGENLKYFTYKYQEELYYVFCQIEMSIAGVTLPKVPDQEEEIRSYVDKYFGLYILRSIKKFFANYYSFNEEKLRTFYHEYGKSNPVQTKRGFVHDFHETSLLANKDFKQLAKLIFNAFEKSQNTS